MFKATTTTTTNNNNFGIQTLDPASKALESWKIRRSTEMIYQDVYIFTPKNGISW